MCLNFNGHIMLRYQNKSHQFFKIFLYSLLSLFFLLIFLQFLMLQNFISFMFFIVLLPQTQNMSFVRILVGNLGVKFPIASKFSFSRVHSSTSLCFYKISLKNFPIQFNTQENQTHLQTPHFVPDQQTLVPSPNDELDMSTKGNWSYFNRLEIITTQKCSNSFENNAKNDIFSQFSS